MQRLFSSFAHGAPGAGLLLMRLAAGASLTANAASALLSDSFATSNGLCVLMLLAALLMSIGLWTPVTGVLTSIAAAWHGVLNPSAYGVDFLLGVLGVALSLLGPGGWSVDAWLYGWKRLEIQGGTAGDSSPDRDDSPPL